MVMVILHSRRSVVVAHWPTASDRPHNKALRARLLWHGRDGTYSEHLVYPHVSPLPIQTEGCSPEGRSRPENTVSSPSTIILLSASIIACDGLKLALRIHYQLCEPLHTNSSGAPSPNPTQLCSAVVFLFPLVRSALFKGVRSCNDDRECARGGGWTGASIVAVSCACSHYFRVVDEREDHDVHATVP